MEPAFDVPIVNVTVVAGQTAVLPCSIEYLGKYKVQILAVHTSAYASSDVAVVIVGCIKAAERPSTFSCSICSDGPMTRKSLAGSNGSLSAC